MDIATQYAALKDKELRLRRAYQDLSDDLERRGLRQKIGQPITPEIQDAQQQLREAYRLCVAAEDAVTAFLVTHDYEPAVAGGVEGL